MCIQLLFVAANSSKGITNTNEELKGMTGHIKTAHMLLTKYARREMTDKLFLFLSLVFFLATVMYIIKKRLLYTSWGYNVPQHSSETITV